MEEARQNWWDPHSSIALSFSAPGVKDNSVQRVAPPIFRAWGLVSMGPKAWGWTATIDLEGHKAISDEKVEKWGRQKDGGEGGKGRRWKANTLPWLEEPHPHPLSLIPGKGMKMGIREGKKSNLSDWAKGHGAILVNKQPLCNWPWGDKNREDSTLSPIASAPWQARDYRLSFPIIPYLYTSYFQTPFKGGLAPREGIQLRAGTAPSQTVLHILCSLLLISTDKLGHLVPLSWGRGDITEMALHHGVWGGRLDRHATRQDDLQGKYFLKSFQFCGREKSKTKRFIQCFQSTEGNGKM